MWLCKKNYFIEVIYDYDKKKEPTNKNIIMWHPLILPLSYTFRVTTFGSVCLHIVLCTYVIFYFIKLEEYYLKCLIT